KGYVVAKFDEVWHFPQRTDKLFCDYVKTFLRLKQQALGYSANVITDADKTAFTPAHARLELYDLMDKLCDCVLYTDTDSVIFVSRDGDWMPPLGDHLGELTVEIGDDDYITEYCSSGPKSYGYRTAKGKVCMKAKGITPNVKNSQVIRLDTLIGLVKSYVMSHDNTQYILAHSENT
ncbi:hypothetical protein M9458_043143, partial [Cirrhinus mrigala]